MRANIALLADFDTTKRPRPHRIIQALKESYNIFVIAREGSPEEGAQCFSFNAPESTASTRTQDQQEYINTCCAKGDFAPLIYTPNRAIIPSILQRLPPLSLIIVEDIALLPFACDYKHERGGRILVDLREFYPLEYEDTKWLEGLGKFFTHLCKGYLPLADMCLCVSETIAARYKRDFKVDSIVYYSLPPYHAYSPSAIHTPLRLIYHGLISKDRGSLNLIELAELLGEGYELSCMVLSNHANFLERFTRLAAHVKNLHILPPVPLMAIIPHCVEYDIGLISLQPTSFNNQHAMPNKLFEYIQSRLCVISTPLDSIQAFFTRYDVGRVSSDFYTPSLADAITSLTHNDIARYKYNANYYAQELSLNSNIPIICNIVKTMLNH